MSRVSAAANAIPKSVTFTSPEASNMMLPGLMSRWTSPAAWAACNAAHTCRATSTASSVASGARSAITVSSVGPSISAITM